MASQLLGSSDLRIRLEGDFERLERLVDTLRAATVAVKAGSVDDVLRAAEADVSSETRSAEQHLSHLGGDGALQDSLRQARAALRTALQGQLRWLGLFPEHDDLLSLARMLHAERVVLRRTYRSKATPWLVGLVAVLLLVKFVDWLQGGHIRLPFIWFFLLTPSLVGTPLTVLVTPRRLRLNKESFLLDLVTQVRIERTARTRRGWTVTVRLRDQREVTKRVVAQPEGLVQALEAVGFSQDVTSRAESVVLVPRPALASQG
jgi:hypothetical protein